LTWDQIHLALGFQAAIMMLAFSSRAAADCQLGIGFYLMLLGGIALLVGAIMRVTEPEPAPGTRARTPRSDEERRAGRAEKWDRDG
jgi:hypothetical protein